MPRPPERVPFPSIIKTEEEARLPLIQDLFGGTEFEKPTRILYLTAGNFPEIDGEAQKQVVEVTTVHETVEHDLDGENVSELLHFSFTVAGVQRSECFNFGPDEGRFHEALQLISCAHLDDFAGRPTLFELHEQIKKLAQSSDSGPAPV